MQKILLITLKTVVRYVADMAVVGALLWLVWRADHWAVNVLWGLLAVLVASLPAAAAGVRAYRASLRATQAHQEYLMGNGANRHGALQPSRLRGIKAALTYGLRQLSRVRLFATVLLLTAVVWLGVPPVTAVAVVALLTLGTLLTGVVLAWLWMFNSERK